MDIMDIVNTKDILNANVVTNTISVSDCKDVKSRIFSESSSYVQNIGKETALHLLGSHAQDVAQITNNVNQDPICTGKSVDCSSKLESYTSTHDEPMRFDIVILSGSIDHLICAG